MNRKIDKELKRWKNDPQRNVLLVRGARQVGKTYSVRVLGESFAHLLEVNFEEHQEVRKFFAGPLSPDVIVEKLAAYFGVPVIPGKTLLFFDEVQACPDCLRSLRFFNEKMPQLHVAAAGSLLEFVLSEIPSFGVGRITSLFMYPLSFVEFLDALGMEPLAAVMARANTKNPVDTVLHRKLLDVMRTYCAIGGMPAVVGHYLADRDLRGCRRVLDDLVVSFRDDFAKYRRQAPVRQLQEVFMSVALQTGGKFTYTAVNRALSHYEIKTALDLLVKAGLVHQVLHTDARGIPLGAQVNPRRFKAILFDIGVYQRLVDLDLPAYLAQDDVDLVNKGPLAELFAGLEMIAAGPSGERPQLYYWHREARNSNAEVDYVFPQGAIPVPVEIKSGRRGAMQSMHLFMAERKLERGIRLSQENYGEYGTIETIPLYAAGTITRRERMISTGLL
jgi:predicted AAA+ superfamily ATPase